MAYVQLPGKVGAPSYAYSSLLFDALIIPLNSPSVSCLSSTIFTGPMPDISENSGVVLTPPLLLRLLPELPDGIRPLVICREQVGGVRRGPMGEVGVIYCSREEVLHI